MLDFDYAPGADAEGWGLRFRDIALRRLMETGVPCYLSNSGNGFHALLNAVDDGTRWLRAMPWEKRSGAQLEVFAPGCKRLLAFNPDRPAGGVALDGATARIPAMAWNDLIAILRGVTK